MADKPKKPPKAKPEQSKKAAHRPLKWIEPDTGKPVPTKMRSLRMTEPAYKLLMGRGGAEPFEREAGLIPRDEYKGIIYD